MLISAERCGLCQARDHLRHPLAHQQVAPAGENPVRHALQLGPRKNGTNRKPVYTSPAARESSKCQYRTKSTASLLQIVSALPSDDHPSGLRRLSSVLLFCFRPTRSTGEIHGVVASSNASNYTIPSAAFGVIAREAFGAIAKPRDIRGRENGRGSRKGSSPPITRAHRQPRRARMPQSKSLSWEMRTRTGSPTGLKMHTPITPRSASCANIAPILASSAMTRAAIPTGQQVAREIIAAEKPKVIVMMIGNNDRQTIREKVPPPPPSGALKANAPPAPSATAGRPADATGPRAAAA